MKKLCIILPLLLVLISGLYAAKVWQLKKQAAPNSTSNATVDKNCVGRSQYGEYGIEHVYKGDLKPGMRVDIVLSCDHKRFTITGAVQQVIAADEELADLRNGSEVVGIESDYDFDGFKDLLAIVSNGQGMEQIDAMHIYLYDPRQNKFVFHKDLSGLENVWPDEKKQEIIQTFAVVEDERSIEYNTVYKWRDGRIIKTREETCENLWRGDSDIEKSRCTITRGYP